MLAQAELLQLLHQVYVVAPLILAELRGWGLFCKLFCLHTPSARAAGLARHLNSCFGGELMVKHVLFS